MKKTLLIAGMIAAPISMAVAKTINFDTPVEWNSKVVEQALNKAGFIGGSGANWDVRVTHDRILTELLNRKSFSLKDATQVCLNKCNMSDFLKNGRGSSGKKCPELCDEFTKTILVENNKQTTMPSANGQSSAFSNLQGKAIDVCRRLMSDAQKSGMSYPVLCGGKCARWLGQDDVVTITDLVQTKEYKVDDFCNNDEKGRDYYYIMDQSGGAQDVSKVEQSQRILKLREIQTQSAKDYISQKEKQAKDKVLNEQSKKYAKLVEKHGKCAEIYNVRTIENTRVDSREGICKMYVHHVAVRAACKVESFEFQTANFRDSHCSMNPYPGADGYRKHNYTPTYKDCLKQYAGYNGEQEERAEEICNGIINGKYPDGWY